MKKVTYINNRDKDNTPKVTLKEMFEEYAKKEQQLVKESDPNVLYHRVLPNLKDKNKGTIEFLYKKIIVGGTIYKHDIILNKLKVTKDGDDKDIDSVIAKIKEVASKGDMNIINELK